MTQDERYCVSLSLNERGGGSATIYFDTMEDARALVAAIRCGRAPAELRVKAMANQVVTTMRWVEVPNDQQR